MFSYSVFPFFSCIYINFAGIMKRILLIMSLMMALASCATSHKHGANGSMHPDEVFTVTEADIARETWQVNSAISGEWKYNCPSVGVSGKNLLAGVAKPFAKGKMKKKLKNAYKKIGLDKASPAFSFSPDGSCTMKILGVNMKGTYNYNPDQEKISFKWHGVPLSANLRRDGKKKLHLTFEADKFLKLISLLGRFSDSSTIKAITSLLDNYEDVMVGFELKK